MSSPVYLDHAGAGQFVPEQIESHVRQLTGALFSNPHSRSASSKLTTDLIDQARYRILQHFNASNEYSVIFTSGCTAALKLVAESLDWSSLCDHCQQRQSQNALPVPDPRDSFSSKIHWQSPGPKFIYLMDNHTSVVGMREYAVRANASVHCLLPVAVDEFLQSQNAIKDRNRCDCLRLFVFPGQSNFCGRKYISENWIEKFHALNSDSTGPRWLVCLDAAALASSSEFDLSVHKPDFLALSFYKIFGYPTGLGALLVRNEAVGEEEEKSLLKKRYFGGGTVRVAVNRSNFVSFRNDSLAERFEDGTVAFQQILALKHGFDALRSRGGMLKISANVFSLASYAYRALSKIKHANGAPVAKLYCHDNYKNPNTQGPIVNFNLLRPDGSYIGYAEAEKMAELYDLHWRTGCFCNQGACQIYLGLTDEILMKNFESGKVCGDKIDLIDGEPVGSIRISFGWTSTLSDVRHFIRMIRECFVDRGSVKRTLDDALIDFRLEPPKLAEQCSGNDKIAHKTVTRQGEAAGADQQTIAFASNGIDRAEYCKHSQMEEDEELFFEALDIDQQLITSINVVRASDHIVLTDIYLFPIKSCAAIHATDWTISERGLAHDRRWMVVSSEGLCLNQKREPKLCMIKPELRLDNYRLLLNCDHVDRSLSIPLKTNANAGDHAVKDTAIAGPYCQSKVCADRVSTADCGDVVGGWVDDVLGRTGCRLVAQTADIPRKGKGGHDADVSLANEEQYLLLHRPSLRRFLSLIRTKSTHITEDDLVLRFRPNLVIDGGRPFAEDTWKVLRIGDVEFQCVGKCTRCQMICIDQSTGEMDKNILLALREFRESKITFGIYLQASPKYIGNTIRVSQWVSILGEE